MLPVTAPVRFATINLGVTAWVAHIFNATVSPVTVVVHLAGIKEGRGQSSSLESRGASFLDDSLLDNLHIVGRSECWDSRRHDVVYIPLGLGLRTPRRIVMTGRTMISKADAQEKDDETNAKKCTITHEKPFSIILLLFLGLKAAIPHAAELGPFVLEGGPFAGLLIW